MDFREIVMTGVESRASDIHLSSGNSPAYRINGQMGFLDAPPLTPQDVDQMIKQCLIPEKYQAYLETGDEDAAAELFNCGRFRVNAMRQQNGGALVLRIINAQTPEYASLNMPESMNKILALKEGLVLVTGPTGSGKSTTLAAIINELNKTRQSHIITIEDPIEYIHHPKKCVINQREVGQDSISYARALKAALREDPDIILVGEMRDLESISIAVTAAETGHLVLSTLHTIGAAKTIDRLIDVFPPEQQGQIRTQLSLVLKSVISQRLLPTADKSGRIAAFEMMFINNAISNLIREGRTANITQTIQTSAMSGMMTLDKSISELQRMGKITKETAEEYSVETNRTR